MFLPLGSDLNLKQLPWVTISWGLICILSFLGITYPEIREPYTHTLTYQLSFIPAATIEPWRLISYQFLHSSIAHLISNLWYLAVFGWIAENLIGHSRFLLFCLLAGALAVLPERIFQFNSALPVVGSSGVVAFTIGLLMGLRPASRIKFLFSPIPIPNFPMTFWVPTKVLVYFWLILQVSGFASNAWGHPQPIAYATHLFGFGEGLFVGLLWRYFSPACQVDGELQTT